MSITCLQLLNSLPDLLYFVSGSKETIIKDVCPAEKGREGSILFISNEKNFLKAIQSEAAIIVVPKSHQEQAQKFIGKKTLLSSPNPTLAMAKTIQIHFSPKINLSGIHSTAIVHPSAKVDPSAWIGPFCLIEENVSIGKNTYLESHVTVEANAQIGTNCKIMSYNFIGSHTQIGHFCELKPHSTIASEGYGFATDQNGHHHRIPQRGIVVLEDYVSIGAQCTIDRATFEETRIGLGSKLDNMVHVAHNCRIGKHCLLSGGTGLAGSTIIGDHVVMGGQSAAAGHLTICDNAVFGGRSAIISNVEKPGAYNGQPLEPLKDNLKTQASLKKLTSTIRDVRKILKHLGLTSTSNEHEKDLS